MPVRKIESTINVLEAAKLRIRNVFANGCKVYLSFSSGKDSLCMASITYDLIRAGAISPKQLTVTFIDEEGLYPSMVEAQNAGAAISALSVSLSSGFVFRSSRCLSLTICHRPRAG